MFTNMELWTEIRRRVLGGELSKRAACREYDLHWDTQNKILQNVEPPGYRKTKPRARPTIEPFLPTIHEILEADRTAPKKQRHTAIRIFERLRDEHGFTGKLTIVTDYVRERKRRTREVFVPLAHPPGHAQVDFGEAVGVIGGVRRKLHYFAMALPQSAWCALAQVVNRCSPSTNTGTMYM